MKYNWTATLLVGVLVAIVMIPLSRSFLREMDEGNRLLDRRMLQNIGSALRIYSDHNGGYPDSIVQLAETELPPGRWCISPGQPKRRVTLDDVKAGRIDYTYVGSGLVSIGDRGSVYESNGRVRSAEWHSQNPDADRTVVMYTKLGVFDGWVNFLFLDGHVEGAECVDVNIAAQRKGWVLGAKAAGAK